MNSNSLLTEIIIHDVHITSLLRQYYVPSPFHLAANIINSSTPLVNINMQLVNNTTISCLRCTDLCLQCNVDGATCRSQSPCHQCDAAGIDFCTFPPFIYRVNPQSNSRCLSCVENKTKCLFGNSSDSKCIRCTKQHLHCCFKLKGECCL